MSIETHGLTDLGYTILLDRYALKNPKTHTERNISSGDIVVAIINNSGKDISQRREVGKVLSVKDGESHKILIIELLTGEVIDISEKLCDQCIETSPEQIWDRVATGVAAAEKEELQKFWKDNFRAILQDWSFVPAGRILSSAGSGQELTAINCWVLPSPSDSRGGIFDNVEQMAELMARGGGVGVNISTLRPKNAYVAGVNGRSSGSVSWGAVYSFVTGLIEQGGSRRGALILILNDWHPDVFRFINSKRTMGQITNANISVNISDRFMETLKEDGYWTLEFPDTSHEFYDNEWDGDIQRWKSKGYPTIPYGKPSGEWDGQLIIPYGDPIKASEIWDAIISSAWASAEPGVWFGERANKMSNSYYYQPLVATNPCVTGDTLVSTSNGYVKAKDLQVGMLIRTPAGLRPIEKFYNNGVQKIWRVEFSDGGILNATADHKLKVVRNKKYEWISVSDIKKNDKVLVSSNMSFGDSRNLPQDALDYIEKNDINLPNHYSRDIGLLVGIVTGDGCLRGESYAQKCSVSFNRQETDWMDVVSQKLKSMNFHFNVSEQSKNVIDASGAYTNHGSNLIESYKLGTFLLKINAQSNTKAVQKSISDDFLTLDREFMIGVLDGLFSTDGNVYKKEDNPMLRYTTSSHNLAQQIRLMLLQFGIYGRIYKSKRRNDLMYDGRSMSGTTKYDVVIMNEGIATFYKQIGLSHPSKQQILKEIFEQYHFIGSTWTASVKSVVDTGTEEEVYDVYEPETLTWVTNGYVSFDCGEQGLPPYGSCNLAAINLSQFYDCDNHTVDFDRLARTSQIATRFLDNVLDITKYYIKEAGDVATGERRIGLGIMGLAELLIKCHVRYGSKESVELVDKIFHTITRNAYLSSIEIAKEKGSFKHFDPDKFIESGFMLQMDEDIRQLVKENGIRNVTLTTVAPTGSTGTLVNTSTGIEPFFSFKWYRKGRLGMFEETMAIAQEWLDQNDGKELPDYFVTAMDLTPHEHALVMGVAQRWVDSSISKTTNAPNDYTIEQTSDLYKHLYELGAKGGTIYRDGSRDEQVLTVKKDELSRSEPESDIVKSTKVTKQERPIELEAHVLKGKTPYGTAYITISEMPDGTPYELFITVGKSGSDLQAQAESMGRMYSVAMQIQPVEKRLDVLKKLVSQNRGIGGARPSGFGTNRIMSFPDAIAKIIEDAYINKISGYDVVETPMMGNEKSHVVASYKNADVCPECQNNTLIRADGCQKCLVCGHSEC